MGFNNNMEQEWLNQYRLWVSSADSRKENSITWDYGEYGTFENWIDNLRGQDMNTEKSMRHFIDWKFGVPVKIIKREIHSEVNTGRLIYEDAREFTVINDSGLTMLVCKHSFYYELIPFRNNRGALRYPVCKAPLNTAYCNAYGEVNNLGVTNQCSALTPEPEPTATLIIDGKEIKLSAETVARLKKDLGVD